MTTHPARIFGPADPMIHDVSGRVNPMHPGGQRTSVIIVSVMPFPYRMDFDTRFRAPSPHDWLSGEPGPETAWLRRRAVWYELPAAPNQGQGPEGWAALEIYPAIALKENIVSLEDGVKGFVPMGTTARDMAASLMRQWSTYPDEGLTGVGLAVVEDPSQITPAFIQDLQNRTRKTLERIVEGVDNFMRQPTNQRRPSASHVRAVQILGLSRAWAAGMQPTKNCPACATAINVGARVCPNCRTNLRDHYRESIEHGYLTMEELQGMDPSLAADLSRVMDAPAKIPANNRSKGRKFGEVPVAGDGANGPVGPAGPTAEELAAKLAGTSLS